MTKTTALVFAGLALVLMTATPALAGGKYDNPYIDDGRLAESPLTLAYEVTEIRSFVSEHGLHYLHHYSPVNADRIVEEWKQSYKAGREISDGFVIIGYAFIKNGAYWSFTCKNKREGYKVTIDILAEDSGSVIALNTRRLFHVRVLRRRSWTGYSPRGYEGEVPLKAN